MNAILNSAVNDNGEVSGVAMIVAALKRALDSSSAASGTFEQQEAFLLAASNESLRQVLEGVLQQEADSIPDLVMVDGEVYRRHQPGRVRYHSLVGTLRVCRWTHRRVDVRNGPTVVPLDLTTQLAERATPAMAMRILVGFANGPMRWCEEELRASHRCPPSRSTMERIAKRVGTEVHRSVIPLEGVARSVERVPVTTRALIVGLDRTTIPMEEALESGECELERHKRRRRPYVRQPRPPVRVHYRMGYVGTVAFVDDDGDTIATKKYAVPANEGGKSVVTRMMADVKHALKNRPDLELGLIQDGAPELWGLMWDALDANGLRDRFYQLIDRYHVSERLGLVAAIIEPDRAKRAGLLGRWERKLNMHDNAMERIWEQASRASLKVKSRSQRKELDGHLTYLMPMDRFCYAKIVKRGLPIGSGVTEGACKSLVAARTKRSGQRWHVKGVTAALTLRSLHESARLEIVWNTFKPFYGSEVCTAA